ncbi:MAG TPA: hypothetical protein VHC63_11675 [Acidimicrobiales bacterium]|nr:hypothetical protein [Acidimicrobiales bacterium]
MTTHEQLYKARPNAPQLVEVPDATFAMIDGEGNPNTAPAFALAIQSLYSVAYGVHFALKKATGRNERVAPLEATFTDTWAWTMMIRLPEDLPPGLLGEVLAATAAKKPDLPVDHVRVERFAEGEFGAGHARRSVFGRAADHRRAAQLHRRPGPPSPRPTSRDLPGRPPPVRSGEVEDADSPARRRELTG